VTEFDLFIEAEGEVGAFSSLAVSPEGVARERGTIPLGEVEFGEQLVRVSGREKGVQLREAFGKRLFDAVFRGDVLTSWARASGGADPVRLRLVMDRGPLATLPWELLHDGLNFLATSARFALSRYIPVPEPRGTPVTDRLRVLLVSASPAVLPKIESSEVDDLAAAIGEAAVVKDVRACTARKLADHIAAAEYHVVHYLGHGAPSTLLLEGDGGAPDPLGDRAFAQMLFGRPSVRLVVLSACNSAQTEAGAFAGVGPALIRARLPAVVAMQYQFVQLSTVQLFNRRLYAELASGTPVDLAVNRARNAISATNTLLDERDWSTPVLYLGTRNARLITLTSEQAAEVEQAAQSVQSAAQKDAAAAAAWETLTETLHTVRSGHVALGALADLRSQVERVDDAFAEIARVAEAGIAGPEFKRIAQLWPHIANDLLPRLRTALEGSSQAKVEASLQPILDASQSIEASIAAKSLRKLETDIHSMAPALAKAQAELDDRFNKALANLMVLSERTIGRITAH
jgi:CHAT domain